MSAWGRSDAVSIILKEHRQLAMVTGGMIEFARRLGRGEAAPGFAVFRSLLFYIREYPQSIHHPKEERYLFTRIRGRTDEIDTVLEDLTSQHAEGEAMVRDMEHGLTRYEAGEASALQDFNALVIRYAKFCALHRRMEEDIVLPVALRVLDESDWTEIDAAFCANRDPFEGVQTEESLDRLFQIIANVIPEMPP